MANLHFFKNGYTPETKRMESPKMMVWVDVSHFLRGIFRFKNRSFSGVYDVYASNFFRLISDGWNPNDEKMWLFLVVIFAEVIKLPILGESNTNIW